MNNKQKLGKRIKELRKKRGLTQEQVAELINMEQNSISIIESGRNFPTLVTLEKIANVLDVSLSDFFNYESFDDIQALKNFAQAEINKMDDYQIRQIFKLIKTIV